MIKVMENLPRTTLRLPMERETPETAARIRYMFFRRLFSVPWISGVLNRPQINDIHELAKEKEISGKQITVAIRFYLLVSEAQIYLDRLIRDEGFPSDEAYAITRACCHHSIEEVVDSLKEKGLLDVSNLSGVLDLVVGIFEKRWRCFVYQSSWVSLVP